MKVRTKLLAFFLPVTLASASAMTYYSRRAVSSALESAARQRAAAIAEGLANRERVRDGLRERDEGVLLEEMRNALEQPGVLYVAMADERSRIVAHSDVTRKGAVIDDPGGAAVLAAGRLNMRRVDPAGYHGPALEVGAPVGEAPAAGADELFLSADEAARAHPRLGSVRVALSLDEAAATSRNLSRRLTGIIVVAHIAALSLMLGFLRGVLAPIGSLSAAIRRLAGGAMGTTAPASTADELGDLARGFNEMSRSLAETTVSKEFLDAIYQNMLDGLIVTRRDGTVRTVNESAARLTGRSAAALEGASIESLFAEPKGFLAPRTRESLALGESLESVDAGLATKSGRVIPVLCSASAFRDQDGEVDGFLIGVKDIAERKIAEEALSRQAMDLMRSNVELEQFAYVASHDLQEPLRKILLFSERLRGGAQRLEPAARDSLARIESSAQRMRHLIDAILRLSKVMRGQVVVEPVALDAVAREALADLEERLAETGGAVEVGPLPRMRVDAEQMRQLFQNLLSNALKFRRPEEAPRIAISSRKLAGGLVEIAVADNGIGFEEKYLDRIFKPFQRLHPMGVYEGSGIGLSICQKIVERHGGMITARSAPGKGTTFLITLPGRQKE